MDKSSGILLSIDFRKAFDILEWPIMHKTLETYNFFFSEGGLKLVIKLLKAQYLIMAMPRSG